MRILVVEDESALAAGLKFNFEQEGYDVTCVGDGPSALRAFEQNSPRIDLVILDLMLPGMSGYEVCSTIRSRDHEVPIIILSARSLSEDRQLAFDCGTDQYLSNPFALPELISRVKKLTERQRRRNADEPEAKTNAIVEFGDVRVDFRRYEATVRGKTHTLTERELQLLRYFVEHEGAVLTRAEILEKVWGESSDLTTRSIDNFVLRLRRLIEINPAEPRHILSIRGAGYRFLAEPDSSDETPARENEPEGRDATDDDTGIS